MENDAIEEYKSSLSDLNCNSKPMINALTIIAEENIKFAAQIVQVIENHVNSASADLKLPVMYLIDSIMKNVGRDYLSRFSERIVSIFSSVFGKVDEKTRMLLYKLRQTWTEIMPNKKLYAIDVSVNQMDPAWPITSQAPAVKSIHINPKFLTGKKQEESASVKEPGTQLKAQQEVVLKQLLAKQQRMRRMAEEAREPEKQTTTSVCKIPTIVRVHPSEDAPNERSVPQKLDPRTVQRDPRLKKSVVSAVANKVFPEDKSLKSITTAVKRPQSPLQKHSPMPSIIVSVPNTNFSLTHEADVSAPSKNERKSEKSSDSPKKKVDKPVTEVKTSSEQSRSEECNSTKRFPSPQKPSIEPRLTEIQDTTQKGQDSPCKSRPDAASSKNKSLTANDKQLNVDSKQPVCNKSSVTERPKVDIKDSHVETGKHIGRPSKGSPKPPVEVEKECDTNSSRSRSKATSEGRRVSPRHRSRSPLHEEDKKKESKSSKIPSRSARQLPFEKADGEKIESSQEPSAVKNASPNDFPKVDTDLRVSARSSVSPEKNAKGTKRDNSACKESENQENVDEEPPVKKVKDAKENENSGDVSWFGNQDQDYRCKEKGSKIDTSQGWARYKELHPDTYKSPLRPARENMENIGLDKENFREAHDKLLPKRSQSEQHMYDGGCDPELKYDRLGRPRLQRWQSQMRNRDRRRGKYDQSQHQEKSYYGHSSNKGSYDVSVLNDPQKIIRQAEEKFRAGIISENCLRDIHDGLKKVTESARRLGIRMTNFGIPPMFNRFHEQDEFLDSRMRQMNKSHGLGPPPQMSLRARGPKPVPLSTCSFELDHVKRNIDFVDDKAIVVIDDVPRQIVLRGQPTQVFIEGMNPITVQFDGKLVEFEVNGKIHTMKFGVPTRELYIDDYPYEGKFGGPPFVVDIDEKSYSVNLGKPIPEVVFLEEPQHELYKKFLAGVVKTEPADARMSPNAEKDTSMEGNSCITEFPIKREDTDFRSTESEKSAPGAVSRLVPFDVDMRTVSIKKEPEECERNEKFDCSEYAENRSVSDMKDVDWRHHTPSMNVSHSTRDNSSYPPPGVDFQITKDSCRPGDAPPDSMLHPGLPRNQIIKSDGEPSFRNVFTDSKPQMQQTVWNGPISHDSLGNNSEKRHEWENNQERAMLWQERDPGLSQLPVQPHDRPLPRIPNMPNWRGGRFTPPYSQNDAADSVLPPRVMAPPQPNWRHPQENLSEGNRNMPVWDWKSRGFRPDAPVPPVHPHPPEQGHPYNMQQNEQKPPFENYRGPYEQLPPPPLPPQAPMSLMGSQLRPVMLRPTIPTGDLRNSGPLPPHQKQWLPRNPLEGMPPPIRERPLLHFPHPMPPLSPQLRTTLPPPPLPPNMPNIPVPFSLPRVPSPVVAEMPSVEPVINLSHAPPYAAPEVQIKSEAVDTSSCQGTVQTVNPGPEQLPQTSEQETSQGSSVNVPLQNAGPAVTNESITSEGITSLLERLVALGILPGGKPIEAEKMEVVEPDVKSESETTTKEEPTPPIEFSTESLKVRYPGVISALFRGTQCASCGMRFKDTHGERYKRHLDWHFRVNRREKDGAKKAFSRKWYYDVEDWIQFEEFEDFEERARSFFELQADEELLQAPAAVEVPTVPAAHGNETEMCVVCEEAFQLLWVEEEEEWHLKNAVREDGQAYHPLCFEDLKKASEIPDTPPVDETPSVDASLADKEQETADKDTTTTEMVPEDEVKTEGGEAEDAKELDDVSAKEENTDEPSAIAEETVEVKEEEPVEEEPLEGKPGEEEIIGVITESDLEEEERKEPPKESKMVVLQSGGIVMKVRAESIQQPASPAPPDKDTDQKKEEESEDEFRPPTPDPRFKVLPPVKKGTELSGLCSIM